MMKAKDRIVALLTESRRPLTGGEIGAICNVGSWRLYPALNKLEDSRIIKSAWEDGPYPRRRIYSMYYAQSVRSAEYRTTHKEIERMPVAIKASDFQRAADILSTSGLDGLANQIAGAIAFERERIAQMVERADNTMMNQDKLANYIRGRAE